MKHVTLVEMVVWNKLHVVLMCSFLHWQIIERETSELEKLRLEKSAVKSQIDEKVGNKVPINMYYLTVKCVQLLFIFQMRNS